MAAVLDLIIPVLPRPGPRRHDTDGDAERMFVGEPGRDTDRGTGPPTLVDVLVVDDDEAVRESLAEIISLAGYSTATACDGCEAFEVLSATIVRAMVLDVRMPCLDGLALLDLLEEPPPVILLTAATVEGADPTMAKVTWYLQKPVPPAHLLDLVASVIGPGPGRPLTSSPTVLPLAGTPGRLGLPTT